MPSRTRVFSWADDFTLSLGLASLVITPYFLEKVGERSYFAFDIADSFLLPHLKSLGVFFALLFALVRHLRHVQIRIFSVKAVCVALVVVFMARGMLSVVGFPPQRLIQEVTGLLSQLLPLDLDPVTVRRAAAFVLFGIGLFAAMRLGRRPAGFFRASSAFGWALLLILSIRVVPLLHHDSVAANARQSSISAVTRVEAARRRVVWVIFDELDFMRTIGARNPILQMPNLDQLLDNSVSTTHAVSPADATAISIPALTAGVPIRGVSTVGPADLRIKHMSGEEISWKDGRTVFSLMHEKNTSISILGFYHPYCDLFPYAEPCSSLPVFSFEVWWWGIWQGLRSVPGIDYLTRQYSWTNAGFNVATRVQIQHLPEYLDDHRSSLTFLHLNVPHLPGNRGGGMNLSNTGSSLSGYENNLVLVDDLIGRIVKALDGASSDPPVLLIISSDHWLRTHLYVANMSREQAILEIGENQKEDHRVPLIMRIFGESGRKIVMDRPVSTVHTAKFIEDYLAGKIKDHSEIAAWWESQIFHPPVVSH